MIVSKRAPRIRMLIAAAAIAVGGPPALADAETGAFQFQNTETAPIDLSGPCLGAGAVGTLTQIESGAGRFTENGPPAFGFHDHATVTSSIRVDLADGRHILGSLISHFD